MKEIREIYIDNGLPLGAYADKIYCCCPRCGNKAVINAEIRYFLPIEISSARIQCLHCAFHQNWSKGKLYSRVLGLARQRCPNCGHKWLTAKIEREMPGELKKKHLTNCPTCQQKVSIDLSWDILWQGDDPVDPYFGYELWLKVDCCGNVLWAYNNEHLSVIKFYVKAQLRDGRNRQKWSMISRLPQWIKSEKNRAAIMKAINKLERIQTGSTN